MIFKKRTQKNVILKGNLAHNNAHHVHFVQSKTKPSVHFRSKILWTYDQTHYVVRPDTLTPYVLTPFERTTKHPRTYVHGKFPRKIRDFMPDKRYFRVFEN